MQVVNDVGAQVEPSVRDEEKKKRKKEQGMAKSNTRRSQFISVPTKKKKISFKTISSPRPLPKERKGYERTSDPEDRRPILLCTQQPNKLHVHLQPNVERCSICALVDMFTSVVKRKP